MSNVGESLLRGAEEALAYSRGKKKGMKTHPVSVPEKINVKKIREKLHLSRKEFAMAFAFSLRTLEKWERGERFPQGPTRAYLTVISKSPRTVRKALSD